MTASCTINLGIRYPLKDYFPFLGHTTGSNSSLNTRTQIFFS